MKHNPITTDAQDDAAAQNLSAMYMRTSDTIPVKQQVQFSEDPNFKTKGGLVEAYAPGVFSDAFDKTVLSLKMVKFLSQ